MESLIFPIDRKTEAKKTNQKNGIWRLQCQ
jgi:hypothetical protein